MSVAAPRRMALLALLLALQALAGCGADFLVPGNYRLRLPGRLTCASQGLLSSFACASGNTRLTVVNRQQPSSEFRLQVVQPAAERIVATTLVRLVATARTACGGTHATWPASCAAGAVTLAALSPAAVRQQWVVEPWGATWRLRPASCPGKYLSFHSTNCSSSYGQVQPSMASFTNAFSLYRAADGTLPPSTNRTAPTSHVVASAVEFSRWGQGYEGAFRLVNNNTYDILSWRLAFTSAGGNFTWGPSDADVTWQGTAAQLVPKEWSRGIKSGATMEVRFGGSGQLPTDLQFTQVLPLLDPDNDPSLAARGAFPAKLFAPFVDVGLYPTPRLLDFYEAAGQQWFTLAFVTADQARKVPAWAGTIGMEKQFLADQIREVRLRGGDVIVSFGGAAGQELAQVVADEGVLLAHYQSVVDLYKLRWVDFDVEGQAVAQPASYDRRNRVLARLQAANPGLVVSFTLPALPTGLTPDGVRLLESCVKHGVRVDVVNIMSMDYGDSAAPDPDGVMGEYAIQAAESTYRQALSVGLNTTQIGNTPMVGRNDVETEVFYQADAHKVARWAAATPWVRWTAFWSLGRDKFNGETYVSVDSSTIPQQPYEFTKIFNSYVCNQ